MRNTVLLRGESIRHWWISNKAEAFPWHDAIVFPFQYGMNLCGKVIGWPIPETSPSTEMAIRFMLPLTATTHLSWWDSYPNGPEAGREAGWGSEFVPLKKRKVGSFILLHKISRSACCFGIRPFLKQYSCYESATIWYTDHQYLTQYSPV